MIRRFIVSTSLLVILTGCGSEPADNGTSSAPTEAAAATSLAPEASAGAPIAKVEPPKALPSLYGQWIPNEERCPRKGEMSAVVITISRDRIDSYENYCSAKPAIPPEGQYSGKLACAAEGEEYQSTATLAVGEDGKLQYESDGSVSTYKRCPWRIETP